MSTELTIRQLQKKQRDMKESTDILARLLAIENITIVDGGCTTSSIDLDNRVINIVKFDDDNPLSCKEVRITSIAHEVGHAIFTPLSLLHNSVDKNYPNLFPYINLVEDIRIESLIKGKYRGIHNMMKHGRRIMFDNGYYGKEAQKNINGLKIFDKILLYTKVDENINGLQLTDMDKAVIRKIRLTAVNESSVIECAKFLYEYCKEKGSLDSYLKQQMDNLLGNPSTDDNSHNDSDSDSESSNDGDSTEDSDESDSEGSETDDVVGQLIQSMLSGVMDNAEKVSDDDLDKPIKTVENIMENKIKDNADSTITSFVKKGAVSKMIGNLSSNLKL